MITEAQYVEAVQGNLGWCTNCHAFTTEGITHNLTPATHPRVRCLKCNRPSVYGAGHVASLNDFHVL